MHLKYSTIIALSYFYIYYIIELDVSNKFRTERYRTDTMGVAYSS